MRPLWFGPEDRPLFGWLHAPASRQVRGAVVLAPPLGNEAVNARHAYRVLADALADEGFAALRFDYDGTGDSAGRQDEPGRVDAWLGSLGTAVELARGLALGRVSVVGMRMGATLAAEILGSGPASIDDLVLWDPCASGRTFLREQSALWAFARGAEKVDDGSIETPGTTYSAETVSELSGRAIATGDGPLAGRVLVLVRSGRTGDRRMNERLALEHAERMDIDGQEDLVDVQPDAAKVPEKTVATIVGWLAGAGPTPTVALDVGAVGRDSARLEAAPGAVRVDERVISVGPVGLFALVTSPLRAEDGEHATPDTPSQQTPTVLFFNAGVIDHVGPARLWVELGRQWAAAGVRAVRFDLSGIGDSPVHEGQSPLAVFPAHGFDDVSEVLRAVSPDPSNAVLVGLCSGAYYAMDEAIHTKVRGVCLINPVLSIRLPGPGAGASATVPSSESGREVGGGMRDWVRHLSEYRRLNRFAQRLPSSAWWFLNRIAVEEPLVRKLSDVVANGVHMLFIVGHKEGRLLIGGEGWTLRKLERTGRFHLEVIPDLEHTLFERCTREIAEGILTEHVIGKFLPASGPA